MASLCLSTRGPASSPDGATLIQPSVQRNRSSFSAISPQSSGASPARRTRRPDGEDHPVDLKLVSAASMTTRGRQKHRRKHHSSTRARGHHHRLTHCIGDGGAVNRRLLTPSSSSSSSAPRHHGLEGGEPVVARGEHARGRRGGVREDHLRLRALLKHAHVRHRTDTSRLAPVRRASTAVPP